MIDFPNTAQFAYQRSSGTTFALDKAGALAYIAARRAALLDAAANTLTCAQTILGYGDTAAADDLIAEARTMFAEAQRLAPKQTAA